MSRTRQVLTSAIIGVGALLIPSLSSAVAPTSTPGTATASASAIRLASEDRVLEVRTIGSSVAGEPILAYRIGTPGGKPVLAAAAIHGDETGALQVTDYIIRQASVPDGLDVWVIPVANPDGYAAGRRTNNHLVDLNRNFATSDWRFQALGTSRSSGPYAGSEPETAALQQFILDVRPRVAIWWHQVGNHVDRQPTVANYGLIEEFARLVGMPILDTPCWLFACVGTATRFANERVAGASSFVVELPRTVSSASAQRQADAFLQIASQA